MTTFILKLKHWQIAVMVWVLPLLFLLLELIEGLKGMGMDLCFASFATLAWGYFLLLSHSLYFLHSYTITLRHGIFLSLYILNIIICICLALDNDNVPFWLALFYFPSSLICIVYTASNYRVVEKIRTGKNRNDLFVDAFLFFMMPYFIWYTQPVINRLVREK